MPLIFETPHEFLIFCKGSSTVLHMLNSEKNKHADKNGTTSKFGQFLPVKNGTFWLKLTQKMFKMRSGLIFVFIIVFEIYF
jgi:hypothetical protein